MCGITLILRRDGDSEMVRQSLKAMHAVQQHRGPDDHGEWVESQPNGTVIGMGHQRLSILDLTSAGHQPMISPCGRYVLVYNGEVYNYLEIAAELGDHPFLKISSGDTAVVLAALATWGIDALRRFNGMWALVWLDRVTGQLLVARDRLGVKPLYWYADDTQLILASEIKAILAAAGRRFGLNRDVVARYLVQSITDAQDETFFSGIAAVPAATYAKFDASECRLGNSDFVSYWQHPFAAPETNSTATITPDALRELFVDAIRLRLRSDVPVGILLSGGVDSSAILAAAKALGMAHNITALSVTSADPASNEEPFIDVMARFAGCRQIKTAIDTDPQSLLHELDDTCWHNDQPVAGFTAVAHRRLMEEARNHGLTVLLTGQGADEQLGGYNKFFYFYCLDCLKHGRVLPALDMAIGCLRHGTVLHEFTLREAKRYIPLLRSRRGDGYAGAFLDGAALLDTGGNGSYRRREYLDMTRYSVPMLLHYEDRMSMSRAREVRVPFLDYRLVEALARVPPGSKLKGGWTKAIFRNGMQSLLPYAIAWRRDKKGFTLPEAQWLRGPLRRAFADLFNGPLRAAELGVIDGGRLRALHGRFEHGDPLVNHKEIFNAYCLETWLRRFDSHITH